MPALSPVMTAARGGDLCAIKAHLDADRLQVNTRDSHGQTSLMWSAVKGHTHVAAFLLDNGAEVDAVETALGRTALYMACGRGHTAFASLLLSRGADITVRRNGGRSALTIAAYNGHDGTVNLLLAHMCVSVPVVDTRKRVCPGVSVERGVCGSVGGGGETGGDGVCVLSCGRHASVCAGETEGVGCGEHTSVCAGGHGEVDGGHASVCGAHTPMCDSRTGHTPLCAPRACVHGGHVSMGGRCASMCGACPAAVCAAHTYAHACVDERHTDGCVLSSDTHTHAHCTHTCTQHPHIYLPQGPCECVSRCGCRRACVCVSEGRTHTCAMSLLDERDDERCSALWYAAKHGRVATVERLLAAGADDALPGDKGMTPMEVSREKGRTVCVDMLEAAEQAYLLTRARSIFLTCSYLRDTQHTPHQPPTPHTPPSYLQPRTTSRNPLPDIHIRHTRTHIHTGVCECARASRSAWSSSPCLCGVSSVSLRVQKEEEDYEEPIRDEAEREPSPKHHPLTHGGAGVTHQLRGGGGDGGGVTVDEEHLSAVAAMGGVWAVHQANSAAKAPERVLCASAGSGVNTVEASPAAAGGAGGGSTGASSGVGVVSEDTDVHATSSVSGSASSCGDVSVGISERRDSKADGKGAVSDGVCEWDTKSGLDALCEAPYIHAFVKCDGDGIDAGVDGVYRMSSAVLQHVVLGALNSDLCAELRSLLSP